MADIHCRQCGHQSPAADFPTGEFRCPSCDWRQIVRVAGRAAGKNAAKGAASAIETEVVDADEMTSVPEVDAEQALAEVAEAFDDVVDDLQLEAETGHAPDDDATTPSAPTKGHTLQCPAGDWLDQDPTALSAEEFTVWCGCLFLRFGWMVSVAEQMPEEDCDLRLTRDGERVVVACRPSPDGDEITTGECQRLVGVMAAHETRRGFLVTSGDFSASCRRWASNVPGFRIELVDGEELGRTVEEMTTGPLSRWLS